MSRDPALSAASAGWSAPTGARRVRAHPELAVHAVYLVTFAVTAFLVLVPLASLLYGAFRTSSPGLPGTFTLAHWPALASRGVVATLANTLVIGILTAVFSTALGAVIAWIVGRTDFGPKRLVTALIGLSFFFPGFILAMAWIILASPGGVINWLLGSVLGVTGWRSDIYSVAGIVWIQVLHLAPFTYFAIRGPLASMDASFEEAAYMSGAAPWRAALGVTIPLMIYPLLSSLLLSFVLAVEQFAIPAMVGIPGHVNVLATQLYLLTSFMPPNHGLAAAVGLALSAVTGLSLLTQRRIVARAERTAITGKSYRLRLLPLGRWRGPAHALCLGYVVLGFVVPTIVLVYTSLIKYFNANPFAAAYTLRNYAFIFQSPSTLRAFQNTLIVSVGGAVLGLALGTLVAYFCQRLRPRGSRVLDVLASLPFGIPGIVIGLGFLWSYVYMPLPLYGTLWVLVFCYIARFLPYATETVGAQMVQLDRSLEEAAWSSGAGRLTALARVVLPILRPSLQSAYLLLFLAYFREIAAAVLLYTSRTAVVSVSIWSFFENANWGHASALSVLSTLVIVAVMAGLSGPWRRGARA